MFSNVCDPPYAILLAYDLAGNLTSDGTGTGTYSYTWDAEGRIKTTTDNTTSVVTT